MPIYEYRRPDGTTFEVVQSFSDEPLTVDPETGVPVERVLHAPAVHFKGKGFYNTDYGTRRRQRETAAAGGGEEVLRRVRQRGLGRGQVLRKGESGGPSDEGRLPAKKDSKRPVRREGLSGAPAQPFMKA